MNAYTILNIPHASRNVLFEQISLKQPELDYELYYGTDWFTDEIFNIHNETKTKLKSVYNRIIVDHEKINDATEPGNAIGRGVIYQKTFDGKNLRNENASLEEIMYGYQTRIAFFNNIIEKSKSFYDKVWIVDCHSFDEFYTDVVTNERLREYPDICLGFNDKNYDMNVILDLKTAFEEKGYSVGMNFPFQGSYITKQYEGDEDVKTVMIEINKKLYVTHNGDYEPVKTSNFSKLANDVQSILTKIFS